MKWRVENKEVSVATYSVEMNHYIKKEEKKQGTIMIILHM